MTIVVPTFARAKPDHDDIAAADFRAAMRHLVGGVSVITVGQGQDISGMTVSSVSSLSIDPPTLIVAINRSASSWPLLVRDRVFGVNILTADQRDIAERFTGKDGAKGRDRFKGAIWTTARTGAPLLVDALVAADCEVEEIIERHSHGIVIGRVRDLIVSSPTPALAYWQGQYVGIGRDDDVVKLAEVGVPATRRSREI